MIHCKVYGNNQNDLTNLANWAEAQPAPDEAGWLVERGGGVGGSDAPVVVGASPWKSALTLWGEKTGRLPSPVLDSDAVEMGKVLEPVALERYTKKSGRPSRRWPSTLIVQHANPDLSFMRCTPDGLTYDNERGVGLVQVKTTGEYSRDEWEHGPPLHVEIQVQHEMETTGASWATIVVLIGGRSVKWFDVTPNAAFVPVLIRQEFEFWRHVVDGDQPPVTYHDAEVGGRELGKTLAALYGVDSGDSVLLDDAEAIKWDERLRAIKAEQKKLEAERDALEALLKDAIGGATVGLLPNGRGYSWKSWAKAGYTVGPTSGRTLRAIGK